MRGVLIGEAIGSRRDWRHLVTGGGNNQSQRLRLEINQVTHRVGFVTTISDV